MNYQQKHTSPIYYPDGIILIISLLLLLLLFFRYQSKTEMNGIPIMFWSQNMTSSIDEIKTIRSYIEIELNDNQKENEIKFRLSQLKIREMIAKKDYKNGVHFHFNDKSNYENFIKAIEICKIEKAKIFVPYKNDLWFFLIDENPRII